MSKKLCRNRYNKKFLGVCSGIADYLNCDPTVIRLVWVLLTLLAGSGVLAYLIFALIMPEN